MMTSRPRRDRANSRSNLHDLLPSCTQATCIVRSDRGPARLRSHAGAAAGVDCQQAVCGSADNAGPLSERVRSSPKTLVRNRSPQHTRCDPMLAERLRCVMGDSDLRVARRLLASEDTLMNSPTAVYLLPNKLRRVLPQKMKGRTEIGRENNAAGLSLD